MESWRELKELYKRYCSRGFRFLNFCPFCLTELLSKNQIHWIKNALCRGDFEEVRVAAGPKVSTIAFFIPNNKVDAEIFGYKLIVYPVCRRCERFIGNVYALTVMENYLRFFFTNKLIPILKGEKYGNT